MPLADHRVVVLALRNLPDHHFDPYYQPFLAKRVYLDSATVGNQVVQAWHLADQHLDDAAHNSRSSRCSAVVENCSRDRLVEVDHHFVVHAVDYQWRYRRQVVDWIVGAVVGDHSNFGLDSVVAMGFVADCFAVAVTAMGKLMKEFK